MKTLTCDRSAVNGAYRFSFLGNAKNSVVPVLQSRSGKFRLIGTATYIAKPHWFITAKHIFYGEDISPNDSFFVLFNNSTEPVTLVEKYDVPEADITFCRIHSDKPASFEQMLPIRISNLRAELNEVVGSFGYAHSLVNPNNGLVILQGDQHQHVKLRTRWEIGGVLAIHPNGRGHIKSECYETSVLAAGKDSGAPLFNSSGFMVGILSTSFHFDGGLPNSTYLAIANVDLLMLGPDAFADIRYRGTPQVYCEKL